MSKQEIWYRVTEKTDTAIIDKVCNLSYSTLFVDCDDLDIVAPIHLPQRVSLAVLIHSIADEKKIKNFSRKVSHLFTRDVSLLDAIRDSTGYECGLLMNVDDKESLDNTVANAPRAHIVCIEFKDPTNIPLELVLATTQNTPTRIFKMVSAAADGAVSFLTMESGSDGIVLDTNEIPEILSLDKAFTDSRAETFALQPAKVTRIQHAGMGDRVCVDTTSALRQDEGMLLGSTSHGGLMICSETHYLPYMDLRPFRVNAGSLHMYVWGPDNHVAYLSDLKGGDRVLAVSASGHARVVTIGRLKIERRPLLLIEAEMEGARVNGFIQDDWHVRVFGAEGEIIPSSEVVPGTELLGYLDSPGRHVGIKIDETVDER
jgi:3-amino-4-hydroxybenzoic acid synthase